MEFLSFINIMATLLGLFLLEMVVLGVRGWKTSRQTPVSHFVYNHVFQYRDGNFCKVFWVTGLWYLIIVPILSVLLGCMVLSLALGLPLESGGGLPSVGTALNLFVLLVVIIFLGYYLKETGSLTEVSDIIPKSVSETGNKVVVKPLGKVKESIVGLYGIIKGKFCPVVTSED